MVGWGVPEMGAGWQAHPTGGWVLAGAVGADYAAEQGPRRPRGCRLPEMVRTPLQLLLGLRELTGRLESSLSAGTGGDSGACLSRFPVLGSALSSLFKGTISRYLEPELADPRAA